MDSEKVKYVLIKSLVVFVAISILFVIYLSIKGFGILLNYCNGAFLFSIIVIGIGGLAFVANAGGFDGVSYSFYYVFKGSRKKSTEEREYKSFVDYMDKKKENRRGKLYTIFPYFIVGFIYLIVSFIFLFLI